MRHWGATTLIDYRAYLGKKYDMFTRLQQTKRISDEIVEINKRIDELNHYMKLIREVVDKFDGLEYQILKYKYMDGMTLSEVAAKVNRSDQYIRNKHAEIIKRIEFVG
nr:sigma-70 family RNA polymerase sigma factor [Staphylococcus hominis]